MFYKLYNFCLIFALIFFAPCTQGSSVAWLLVFHLQFIGSMCKLTLKELPSLVGIETEALRTV